MKVLFLGKDESVIICDEITVTVINVEGGEVTLAINAPEGTEIGENESINGIEVVFQA